MSRKLAIDWDESELRIVASQSSGSQILVTDAVVVPIMPEGVSATLKKYVHERGFEKTDTLVAIGRGKAELRELQLPPVPDDELPDIVRFQSIRNFASAGESATIDYLVTQRAENGIKAIAAAVPPLKLEEVQQVCNDAGLVPKRISLRPLAAAALYLAKNERDLIEGDVILIDLLADDAEIIIARGGNVVFVRTVRITAASAGRPRALVNELRRSMLACGSSQTPSQVVLWGRDSVHQAEIDAIGESTGAPVKAVNPFELVEVDGKLKNDLPEHLGRLAPLVGLLFSDEACPHRLIDFLNPRQRVEQKPDHRRTAVMIGVPAVAALLLLFFGYRQLSQLDREIETLKRDNAAMRQPAEEALQQIAKTEKIDQFLDADAIWLNELRAIATKLPPSNEVMLKSIIASSDVRTGVSTLTLSGTAINPGVIEKLEESIRDENHVVVGEGVNEQDSNDAYRWRFTGRISIPPEYASKQRYDSIERLLQEQASSDLEPEESAEIEIVEEPNSEELSAQQQEVQA